MHHLTLKQSLWLYLKTTLDSDMALLWLGKGVVQDLKIAKFDSEITKTGSEIAKADWFFAKNRCKDGTLGEPKCPFWRTRTLLSEK
jgi:hypothetical protein